jgi:hypothetical protein
MDGRWCRACGVTGQRASLDGRHLSGSTHSSLSFWLGRLSPFLLYRLLVLLTGVVVGDLHADLASVLALAVEAEPFVALASTRGDDGVEVRKGLADKLRLLVVVEDGDLEAVVVGRVVDGEAQFLVPAYVSGDSGLIEAIATIWAFGLLVCPSLSSLLPCPSGPRSTGPAFPWSSCWADCGRGP